MAPNGNDKQSMRLSKVTHLTVNTNLLWSIDFFQIYKYIFWTRLGCPHRFMVAPDPTRFIFILVLTRTIFISAGAVCSVIKQGERQEDENPSLRLQAPATVSKQSLCFHPGHSLGFALIARWRTTGESFSSREPVDLSTCTAVTWSDQFNIHYSQVWHSLFFSPFKCIHTEIFNSKPSWTALGCMATVV